MRHHRAQPLRRFSILVLALAGLVASSCAPDGSEPTDPRPTLALGTQAPDLTRALAAQARYTERLLRVEGVVGTAVGLGADGQAEVQLYTKVPGVPGLPARLDGVSVSVVVTGEIRAMPIVADAPAEVSAGTRIQPERLIQSSGADRRVHRKPGGVLGRNDWCPGEVGQRHLRSQQQPPLRPGEHGPARQQGASAWPC